MKIKKTNKLKRLLNIILVLLLFGCSNNNKKLLPSAIEDIMKSERQNKVIDLKEVYQFKWDTLYMFGGYSNRKSISDILGFDCVCSTVGESDFLYVFLSEGKEVERFTVSDEYNYEFSMKSIAKYDRIMRVNAKEAGFQVFDNKLFYSLVPIGIQK